MADQGLGGLGLRLGRNEAKVKARFRLGLGRIGAKVKARFRLGLGRIGAKVRVRDAYSWEGYKA